LLAITWIGSPPAEAADDCANAGPAIAIAPATITIPAIVKIRESKDFCTVIRLASGPSRVHTRQFDHTGRG